MSRTKDRRPSPVGKPLLLANGIRAGYGQKTVIRDADFSVCAGSIVALLGANGCGKTTLLKAVIGLLPVMHGSSCLSGLALEKIDAHTRATLVAWVPQTANSAWAYTVRETVSQGRYVHCGPFREFSKADKDAVSDAMEEMDVSQYAERPLSELSGGEARRVLIARALAQDTPLLALDEPAAHLDPGRQVELMEILKSISRAGKGVLVSLHDVNAARRYADQVLLIRKDGSSAFGTCDEILTPDRLEEAYETEFLHGTHDGYGRFVLPVARKKAGSPRKQAFPRKEI